MNKVKFTHHLEQATKQLIEFTKTLCYNDLSNNYKYIITPNMRTVAKDDEHLNEMEISVLERWNKYAGQILTVNQIIDLLHHENKVPVWVDISVYESKSDLTVIELVCSRRLREEKELMHPGFPPFHLQVATPPNHLKDEIEGKFDVNWKLKRENKRKPKGIITRLKQLFNVEK